MPRCAPRSMRIHPAQPISASTNPRHGSPALEIPASLRWAACSTPSSPSCCRYSGCRCPPNSSKPIQIDAATTKASTMDEPTERLLDYDGGQLYVRDHPGRTPAIVAMHGFPDDSRIYDRLIGPLDPQRVVTFDWIGYGRSSRRDSGESSAISRQQELLAVWDAL